MAVVNIKGLDVLLDDDMVETIAKRKWSVDKDGYLRTGHQGRTKIYHIVLGTSSIRLRVAGRLEIDHINRNILDNRRENLRIVTRRVNSLNLKVPGKGYYLERRTGMYKVRLIVKGKNLWGGKYKTEEEAAKVAKALRVRVVAEAEL